MSRRRFDAASDSGPCGASGRRQCVSGYRHAASAVPLRAAALFRSLADDDQMIFDTLDAGCGFRGDAHGLALCP
jgi:hypothetical protein